MKVFCVCAAGEKNIILKKQLKKHKWETRKEIQKQQYSNPNEFTEDLKNLNVEFDVTSLYEPYYCFFLWLKRKNQRFLFLNAELLHPDTDELATKVYALDNKPLLIHTWYARAYGKNAAQTKRIDSIIDTYAPDSNDHSKEAEVYKDEFFKYKLGLRKLKKRIQTVNLKCWFYRWKMPWQRSHAGRFQCFF